MTPSDSFEKLLAQLQAISLSERIERKRTRKWHYYRRIVHQP